MRSSENKAPTAQSSQPLLLPVQGPRHRWRVAIYVLFALYGIIGLVSFIFDPMVYSFGQVVMGILGIANLWLRWRQAAADHYGIRRQSMFRATPWSEVQALIEPGRWDPTVHLRTTTGKKLPTGVPAADLDSLVELSGKPVEPRSFASTKATPTKHRDLSVGPTRGTNLIEHTAQEPWASDTTPDNQS